MVQSYLNQSRYYMYVYLQFLEINQCSLCWLGQLPSCCICQLSWGAICSWEGVNFCKIDVQRIQYVSILTHSLLFALVSLERCLGDYLLQEGRRNKRHKVMNNIYTESIIILVLYDVWINSSTSLKRMLITELCSLLHFNYPSDRYREKCSKLSGIASQSLLHFIYPSDSLWREMHQTQWNR